MDIRHPSRELALEAGQQARYGAVAVTAPARADMEQAMAWREGVLVFRDMPLSGGGRDQPLPARPHHGAGRCAGGAAGQRAFQIARLDLAIDRIREAFGAHVRQLPGIVLLS